MSRYQITVKPGSSQEKIVVVAPDKFTVYLRAKPHDGEANEAMIRLLAKYLKVSKTSIKITHGQKSRIKIVEF